MSKIADKIQEFREKISNRKEEKKRLKKAAASASDAVGEVELSDDEVEEQDLDTVERARRVAEAGPPVRGTSLSPAGNPDRQQRLGRGDADIDEGSMEELLVGQTASGDEGVDMEAMAMGTGDGDQEIVGYSDDGLEELVTGGDGGDGNPLEVNSALMGDEDDDTGGLL